MSAYYRTLAFSGEKGLINAKYTCDEWAILGEVPNRERHRMYCRHHKHVKEASSILKYAQMPTIFHDGVTYTQKHKPAS